MRTMKYLLLLAAAGLSGIFSLFPGGGGSNNDSQNVPLPPPPGNNENIPDVPLTPVDHVTFVDATTESGITFFHSLNGNTAATLVTGGVAVGDYDGDGWLDIYLAQGNGGASILYENRSQGGAYQFADVTDAAGVGGEVSDMAAGPAFVDYDGDGDEDLFVGSIEQTPFRVYENLGDGTFDEITAAAGLDNIGRENNIGVAFGDYDQDGDLDLFIGHWTFTLNETPAGSTRHLWRNEGDGRFVHVSDAALITDTILVEPVDYTFTPTFADIDNDGDSDLLVVADNHTTQMYINDGDLGGGLVTFSLATDRAVITDEAGMGSSVADFDNDGDLDWFVSSISLGDDAGARPTKSNNAGFNLTGNRYYRNEGNGVFIDDTEFTGVRKGYWGWASCAADFNNDGLLDIFHVNGMLDSNTNAYEEDPSRLFINNGDGTFTEYSEGLGLVDRKSGRGVVCFDGDQDGDIDILVANNNDAATLFRNDGGNQLNYVNVSLQSDAPNTRAIGARIYLTSNGVTQLREIHNGNNYVSQNPSEQHFGLGNTTMIDEIRVVWPDGSETSRNNIDTFQRVTVAYPDTWSTD